MCTTSRSWESPKEANGSGLDSGREEFDRLGGRHRFDVPGFEAEHADAGHELALELGVVEIGRDHAAVRDFAGRGDRELHDHLALQLRQLAQRTAVERIDRGLVAVEDDLDLLAAARGPAARPGAARRGPRVADLVRKRRHRRAGRVTLEVAGAAAEAGREISGIDAAAADAGAGR